MQQTKCCRDPPPRPLLTLKIGTVLAGTVGEVPHKKQNRFTDFGWMYCVLVKILMVLYDISFCTIPLPYL